YQLKLHFDRLVAFPAALTLRHTIDKQSPLSGETAESLQRSRAMIMISVVGAETVIPASVQTYRDYSAREIHFNRRFVDIYTDIEPGKLAVDYARINETEPVAD